MEKRGGMPARQPLKAPENLERVEGIEPSLSAWEADVLPLNHTREAWHLILSLSVGQEP